MASKPEFRCEVCGLVAVNPTRWFMIRCGDSELTVHRWNSEAAKAAGARHYCGGSARRSVHEPVVRVSSLPASCLSWASSIRENAGTAGAAERIARLRRRTTFAIECNFRGIASHCFKLRYDRAGNREFYNLDTNRWISRSGIRSGKTSRKTQTDDTRREKFLITGKQVMALVAGLKKPCTSGRCLLPKSLHSR
jgi:hypothetical protein